MQTHTSENTKYYKVNSEQGRIVVLSLLTRTRTHKYKNTYLVKGQTHTSENTKCSTVNSEQGWIVVLSLLTRTQIQKHIHYVVKGQTHTSENTKCSTVNSEPGRIVVLSKDIKGASSQCFLMQPRATRDPPLLRGSSKYKTRR